MATVHMSDHEVTRDFTAVLEAINQGAEVIVEKNHLPVALIRPLARSGRLLSECIASAKATGSRSVADSGFARDVEASIADRLEPWNPPSWD